MSGFLKNKKVGFYVSFIACILTLVSLILYTKAANQISIVIVLLSAALVIEVLCLVVSSRKFSRFMNLSMPLCTVLLAGALVQSLTTQLDALGYAVAGLYTIDQVMPYLRFAVAAAAAFVVFLISSFMDYGKE